MWSCWQRTGRDVMERAGKTILVVEDTAVVRTLVAAALRAVGYNVEVASHGIDALATLSDGAIPVDVLVTDLSMPVMGGEELISNIRGITRYQHLPIVMLTADTSTTSVSVVQYGHVKVMEKPVDLKKLVSNVDELLSSGGDTFTTSNQPPANPQLATLLPLYIEEGQNHLASIKKAAENHDNEAIRESAHALKGISITIGANSVEEVARKLESMGKRRETEGLSELIEQLQQSFERYIAQPSFH